MKEISPKPAIEVGNGWKQNVLPGYEDEVTALLNERKIKKLGEFFTNPRGRVTAIRQDSKDLTAAVLTARFSRANEPDSTELYWNEFLKKTGEDVADRILNEYGDDSVREQGSGRVMIRDVSVLTSMRAFTHPLITGIEASTRYIDWGNLRIEDFAVRPEKVINDPEFGGVYLGAIERAYDTYKKLWPLISAHVEKSNPQEAGQSNFAYKKAVKGAVCDTLRALLPLGIKTSFGIHAHYRSFSEVVMNLRASDLDETKEVADEIEEELMKVNPVFVKVADGEHGVRWTEYQKKVNKILKDLTKGKTLEGKEERGLSVTVDILNKNWSKDLLREALLSKNGNLVGHSDQELAWKYLSYNALGNLLADLGEARNNRRHKLPDAFNAVVVRAGIEDISFGSFKDLNRHRALLFKSEPDWSGGRGFVVPRVIEEIGGEVKETYVNCQNDIASARKKLEDKYPEEAKLLLTHGTRTAFEIVMGLTECFWVAELRSIPSGHEEYRAIAVELYRGLIEAATPIKELGSFVNESNYKLGRIDEAVKADLKGKTK